MSNGLKVKGLEIEIQMLHEKITKLNKMKSKTAHKYCTYRHFTILVKYNNKRELFISQMKTS